MKNFLPTLALALITTLTGSHAQGNATTTPGYGNITSTLEGNSTFSFGDRYAVLNLDLINGIVGSVNSTQQGQTFINSTLDWVDAVQAKEPRPLTVWTRIYFSNSMRPELGLGVPFNNIAGGFGNITEESETGQLYPAFKPLETDVVLPKTRFYAGAGNALEEILRAYQIDTVVLSGVRTSGVILTTAIRLYDLDYNVYVIADNVIETPPDGQDVHEAILNKILPKFTGTNVISLQQAKEALGRSG